MHEAGVHLHAGLSPLIGRQVETFEVVKVNLYNTLGQLATVMDDVQLDLLFKKFEDSRSRPLPDTLRLFELLQRLVASDTRVRPGPRHSSATPAPCSSHAEGRAACVPFADLAWSSHIWSVACFFNITEAFYTNGLRENGTNTIGSRTAH